MPADTNDRLRRAEALFDELADLPRAERAGVLAARCPDDAELRERVARLLAQLDSGASFLDKPPSGVVEIERDGLADPTPTRIGPFQILRLIGEGGMGRVYEARQDQPSRTVALKLIRPGLLTAAVQRRFELEAEILGQLHHPGIAQVYQAGTVATPQGDQPYIAMELIRGEPLDAFVRGRHLGIKDRLLLLTWICDAVQHAHQIGVIHRDLKPGNVLVEDHATATGVQPASGVTAMAGAGVGLPKILDFGIARVMQSGSETVTLHTDPGALVGTLGYMSPEQAAGDSARIDTRSDVYSLGVMLYELVAGRLPLEVRGLPIAEAARRIAHDEAPSLGLIDRQWRGDIATIAAKALEKEKERRYGSAGELAADIRRYLADEPIMAQAASRVYVLRKFARRNKPLVAATGAIALTLVGATVVSLVLYFKAEAARRDEQGQRAIAQIEAANAGAISDFILNAMIRPASPEMQGKDVKVVQTLENARRSIAGRFADTPEVEAEIRTKLATVLMALGSYADSIAESRRALELYDALETRTDERSSSERVRERWFNTRVDATVALGQAQQAARRFEESEQTARRLLVQLDASPWTSPVQRVAALNLLGETLQITRKFEEAEGILRRSLGLQQTLAQPEPGQMMSCYASLTALYLAQNRDDDAESMMRASLEICRKAGGSNRPALAMINMNLANLMLRKGRPDEALALAQEAMRTAEEIFPPGHAKLFYAYFSLGTCLRSAGKTDEAIEAFQKSYDVSAAALGPYTYESERAVTALRDAHAARGHADDTIRYARLAAAIRLRAGGQGEIQATETAAKTLRAVFHKFGREDELRDWPAWYVAFADEHFPPSDPNRARFLANLALAALTEDRVETAEQLLLAAWESSKAGCEPADYRRFIPRTLAGMYRSIGRIDDAAKWDGIFQEEMAKKKAADGAKDKAPQGN